MQSFKPTPQKIVFDSSTAPKIVLENFNKPCLSNPSKSIAEAMIDESITYEDIRLINDSKHFPANDRGRIPGEPPYRSMDAMMMFTTAILPYLSDKALYHVTDLLARYETTVNDDQAYRTSTLAKYFMVKQFERNAKTDTTALPSVHLSHMHTYVLPCWKRKKWNEDLAEFYNQLMLSMDMKAIPKSKFKDASEQIKAFNAASFDPKNLSAEAASCEEFLLSLKRNTRSRSGSVSNIFSFAKSSPKEKKSSTIVAPPTPPIPSSDPIGRQRSSSVSSMFDKIGSAITGKVAAIAPTSSPRK